MPNTAILISSYVRRPLAHFRFSRRKVTSWLVPALLSLPIHAQVVTDGTVGAALTLNGPDVIVTQDLGTLLGNNLFHSFQTFNIESNGSATFTGADSVSNVISRVTGGDISNFNGSLRSEVGQADFYFINPAGVAFGAGAQVDVPASFHVSTAEELRFSDGSVYSATNPAASTLTLAAPEAFGFLGQGQASITIDQAQLEFEPDSSVSIISNDLTIRGGRLNATGGQIRIIAMGNSPLYIPTSGNVATAPTGNLSVTNSTIDAGDGGGYILLHAGDMLITERAAIRGRNTGDMDTSGTDIEIIASNLTISNRASIFISSLSAGRAGSVRVAADQLIIDGQAAGFFTGIANQTRASGAGGDIEIITSGQLTIVNGGRISGSSIGQGDAGKITVTADQLLIDNQNSNSFELVPIFTGVSSDAQASGAGGDIVVNTNVLAIVNGGAITGISSAQGNAGTVTVNSNQLLIDQQDSNVETGVFGQALDSGAGGDVVVNASDLTIVNGGVVSGSSSAQGNAGIITINSDQLFIDREDSEILTGVTSQALDSGTGGDIVVNTSELTIANGGVISGSSTMEGDAGTVAVNAQNLLIDQQGSQFFTGITSASVRTEAGSINVNAGDIVLRDGQITTSTSGTNSNGGPITVSSDVLVLNSGFIQANAVSGQGGNILIDTDAVVASSNTLVVGGVEQLAFQNDGSNVIQAVAPDGVNGLINLNAPEIDVSGSLLALEPNYFDITELVFDPCAAFVVGAPSTFTVLGRGGLPFSDSSDLSFSLTGYLLDELLNKNELDVQLNTFDRVRSINTALLEVGTSVRPSVSSVDYSITCG